MQLNITGIVIVTGRGQDSLSITSTLPDQLDLKLPAGSGRKYCARNFPGVPIEVVTMPTNDYKFGRKEAGE